MGRAEQRLHAETSGLLVTPPAHQVLMAGKMALVDETSADRARAGVQVFVAAPDGEVRIVVVQGERHVAYGVGEVEADDTAGAPSGACNSRQIEGLAGAELDARP